MVRVMLASGRSRMSFQPRERPVRVEVGGLERVGGVLGVGLAGEAYAGEALGGGEDDAPGGVDPGVGRVLAEDGALGAVDGEESVEGKEPWRRGRQSRRGLGRGNSWSARLRRETNPAESANKMSA